MLDSIWKGTMPRLSIEPAGAGDVRDLAREDAGHLGILTERLARADERKGMLLVARRDGEAVGHIYLWLEPADEPELRERLPETPLLMNLWVHRDSRKQGIGTALVAKAERRLRKLGHRQVALGVEPGNRAAINLYSRLGYREYGQLKTHYDKFLADGRQQMEWEICAVYMKELDA